jgi:hypothetical protein
MRLGQGIYDMIQKNSTGAKKSSKSSRPRA